MAKTLDIQVFLKESVGHLMLDVRSPGEYTQGHIPHAVNLPLFDNEERARVGTSYKQQGREPAIELGLEIVGPKLASFVRFVKENAPTRKVYVHCWRGGMRSGSMAWLLETVGLEVYTLRRGYKAYRQYVLDTLALPRPYIVIGGRTGSGKTDLLHELTKRGEQIIDLEGIASHRGSAFGALGLPPQPTTEQFENLVFTALQPLDIHRRIWIEDESKNIGSCHISNGMWEVMRTVPLVVLDIPLAARIKRSVRDYGAATVEGLEAAIQRISRRLGGESTKAALQALYVGNYEEVACIALLYYDKTYDYGLEIKLPRPVVRISDSGDSIEYLASTILLEITENIFDGKMTNPS